MIQRIVVAAILVPVLFIVLFFLPPYILVGVISLICAISAYELLHSISGFRSKERLTIYALFSAVLMPIGVYFEIGLQTFTAVFFALMCILFIEGIVAFNTIRKIKFEQILTALFAGAVIPYMLSTLISMRIMPEGRLLVLIPFVSAFLSDGGAYFIGVLIGKRKAFPKVSPKKTVEGFIGGIVIGTASVVVYGVVLNYTTFHYIEFWAFILYGFVGAIATELGDLAFSLIKREYEIKDFGRLLPGHGGVLDRFDSMVFTAPAIYLLIMAIPAVIVRG